MFVFASDGVTQLQPAEEETSWKTPNLIGITVFPGVPEAFTTVLGPGYYDVVAANCCPPVAIAGGGRWAASFTATVVPEPSVLALGVPLSLALMQTRARRRRSRQVVLGGASS